MLYTCNCEAVREELALATSRGISESHSQPSIAEGVSGSAPTSPAAGSSKSIRRSTHHQTLSLGSKEMLDQVLVMGGPTGSAAGSNAASINAVGGGPGAAAGAGTGAGANGAPGPMQTRRDSSSGPYSNMLHSPHVHELASRETSPDLLKLEAEAHEETRHTSVCVDALCSNLLQPSTMARATLRKLHPRKKRRTTIPARTVGTINMWTILKSNIGKTIDFYRMPIPVRCLPPSTPRAVRARVMN